MMNIARIVGASAAKNFLGILSVIVSPCLFSQTGESSLYGNITLLNGTQYEGQIRWDDEESIWEDVFIASKFEHPMGHLLTVAEENKNARNEGDFQFDFMQLWADKSPDQSFTFRCRFGDIQRLEREPQYFSLLLKNGNKVKLRPGRTIDPEEDLMIFDRNLGRVSFEIKDIQVIEFLPTPRGFKSAWGDPVYGRVFTAQGPIEGFIIWDDEERMGKDLISGRHQGIKIDFAFEDIQTLKAQNDGSMITLRSGRTLFLNKHDDVDSGNHGITIHNPHFGKLTITWRDFISMELLTPAENFSTYNQYRSPSLLKGTIRTLDGETYFGQIIYDLDEIYDIEFLNGKNLGFEYQIPFRLIQSIEPQNDKFSLIRLKNGQQLVLGGNADVNAHNNGLVIKLKNSPAKYLDWENIASIEFN